MGKLRVFSCFSGVGMFEVGILSAARANGMGVEIVGCSEIDKFASSVYRRHFPEVYNYGDIRDIREEELPDFDCLTAGFCCQSHSVIGKRRGLGDPRGQLIFDVFRILRAKRPRTICLENVKGLLSSDRGVAFKRIITELDALGYDLRWQVCNAVFFGTPQARERIILVGFRRGESAPQVFPTPALTEPVKTVFEDNVVVSYSKTRGKIALKNTVNTITASYRGLGGYNEPGIFCDGKVRRLTPSECEKLQCMPIGWTEYGAMGEKISDTRRYRMCGNAVCANVIQAVFEQILLGGVIEKDPVEGPSLIAGATKQ